MKSLSLVLVVSILYGVVSPSLQCPVALVMTGCVCTPIMTRFLVRCNGISIDLTISAIRNQTEIMDFISRVEIIAFTAPSETVLAAGTFEGFAALHRLTICCSRLEYIEPLAFTSLEQIEILDLRDNRLRWLSAASLTGLGDSLETLHLEGNSLQNLRSDLQPLLTSVLVTIGDNNAFICDCHLSWLPTFIATNSPIVQHEGANCSLPQNVPITDPTINFNSSNCGDLCSLGYHNCHANASCSLTGNETTCTCLEGFSGDGTICVDIDPCRNYMTCHEDATCSPDYVLQTVNCSCLQGFTGDGMTCFPINPCQTDTTCHEDATCSPDYVLQTVNCSCLQGFTGDGMTCFPINPCQTDTTCHEDATCSPDYVLQTVNCSCLQGFTGDGMACIRIDPCQTDTTCHEDATCIPDYVLQTVNCSCLQGFTGDGMTCIRIDPCQTDTTCHEDATCIPDYVLQTVNCSCLQGFTGDGMACVRVDPCQTDTTCHEDAMCLPDYVLQTVRCICLPNFTGNGMDCISIDSCLGVSCPLNATCISGICQCDIGFTGDDCSPVVMVDPCEGIDCHSNATCIPPRGVCECNSRFEGDGKSCELLNSCDEACPMGTGLVCLMRDDLQIRCVSGEVLSLQDQLLSVAQDPSSDPGLTYFTSNLTAASVNISYSEDVPVLINLLLDALSIPSNLSSSSYKNLVDASSNLLDDSNHPLWAELEETEISLLVLNLLLGLENLGERLFLQLETGQVLFTSNNVAVVVIKPGCGNNNSVTVSSDILEGEGMSRNDSFISLPPTAFVTMEGNCMDNGVVVVLYDGIGPLLSVGNLLPNCTPPTPPLANGQCPWYTSSSNCSNQTVDGVVISASIVTATDGSGVEQVDTSSLLDPVRISFQHVRLEEAEANCAFLNERMVMLENAAWLTERCRVVEEESSDLHTVCECYHLTSFAVLLSPTGSTPGGRPLQIVSKIGLCISIVCLLITILLLFTLDLETKQLHRIHRQLALALCLAQSLFLIGVDRSLVPSHDAVCTTIAVLLHYLFLCTFGWQLVEGVHLYLFIVKVFYNDKLIWLYYPLAWGIPLVVVAITLGLRFCNYGSEHYCWITVGGGTNWAFHGPVIVVLVVNLGMMFVISYILVRAAKKKTNHDTPLLCTLLHASFVLVPVLGITWALGFFVVGDSTAALIIEWLFCVFTTLQGLMIFIMHCVLNREVRKAFLKAMGCREAANKQATNTVRRTSVAYLRRKSSAGLLQANNIQLKDSMFVKIKRITRDKFKSQKIDKSGRFSLGRPSLTTAHQLSLITEENGYSVPDSLPPTPTVLRRGSDTYISRGSDSND